MIVQVVQLVTPAESSSVYRRSPKSKVHKLKSKFQIPVLVECKYGFIYILDESSESWLSECDGKFKSLDAGVEGVWATKVFFL